jgi:hypothetical protein
MSIIRCGIALSILCAAAPAALLLVSTPAVAKVRSIEVGPIWNQMDADRKCPKAAHREGGTWTGQWRTTRPGTMSECDIRFERRSGWNTGGSHVIGTYNGGGGSHVSGTYNGGGHGVRSIEVGPIWNQMDAERKCPDAARKAGGIWTGQWRTTRPGTMSECDVRR